MTVSNSHSKHTQISCDAIDISPWANASDMTRAAEEHQTTPYGVDDHTYDGGLGKGEFVASGYYDKTATTGTGAVLKPRKGTKCAMIRKCEGTGTGKPQETFTGLLVEYKESNPVNDYVKWSAKWTISGPVVDTVQS